MKPIAYKLTKQQADSLRSVLDNLPADRRHSASVVGRVLRIPRARVEPFGLEIDLAAQSYEDDDEETAGTLYELVVLLALELSPSGSSGGLTIDDSMMLVPVISQDGKLIINPNLNLPRDQRRQIQAAIDAGHTSGRRPYGTRR